MMLFREVIDTLRSKQQPGMHRSFRRHLQAKMWASSFGGLHEVRCGIVHYKYIYIQLFGICIVHLGLICIVNLFNGRDCLRWGGTEQAMTISCPKPQSVNLKTWRSRCLATCVLRPFRGDIGQKKEQKQEIEPFFFSSFFSFLLLFPCSLMHWNLQF